MFFSRIPREYEDNPFVVIRINQVDMKKAMCDLIDKYMDQIVKLAVTKQIDDHERLVSYLNCCSFANDD